MPKSKIDEKMIDELKFNSDGLIPAIIIDNSTKKVLMLAYMSKESLKISLEKKLTCFYSRSRKTLWLKGETSGAYQHIVSISTDCDKDSLLISVVKDGPACHTGTDSCFDNREFASQIFENQSQTSSANTFTLDLLMQTIADRKINKKEGSYTSYLFEKGLDKIMKKVGEECTEVIIAATEKDKKETIYEIADLTYHLLVLMLESKISLDDIRKELASRHVIDKKVKQEKMT